VTIALLLSIVPHISPIIMIINIPINHYIYDKPPWSGQKSMKAINSRNMYLAGDEVSPSIVDVFFLNLQGPWKLIITSYNNVQWW